LFTAICGSKVLKSLLFGLILIGDQMEIGLDLDIHQHSVHVVCGVHISLMLQLGSKKAIVELLILYLIVAE
ncbi:hypothetical protein, partial [Amedibacterium intestinale]|uniref:hypothetical protein n=1 Tax=Amedibacterium intestinale TaxID=2583452 RepID=UPI0022E496CB